ncbi:hypothetical protein GCM10011332_32250 [Terasakiella brassicae]|uniref:Uncharacterized protein n=1 Tax=Terasakiella brassicae TaxID=1634917 RepID=A0A917C8J1_9PROT|nr:hypothetical protein [Terasakiella brassicae]GGF75796.1 hypothetical protein GCM10011332_32250 [Terasakiella brassicae]
MSEDGDDKVKSDSTEETQGKVDSEKEEAGSQDSQGKDRGENQSFFEDDFSEFFSFDDAKRVKEKFLKDKLSDGSFKDELEKRLRAELEEDIPELVERINIGRLRADMKLTSIGAKKAVADKVAGVQVEAYQHFIQSHLKLMHSIARVTRSMNLGNAEIHNLLAELDGEKAVEVPDLTDALVGFQDHLDKLPKHLEIVIKEFLQTHGDMFKVINNDLKAVSTSMFQDISADLFEFIDSGSDENEQ